jgi:hypothetical protein
MPKKSKKSRSTELAVTALSYRGASKPRKLAEGNETITLALMWDQPLTASATAINTTWTMNNPSNCTDWADYASSWDEYRVLSLRVEFHPNSKFTNPTGNSYAPFVTVVDRDTSTALVSYAAAANYGSLAYRVLDDSWFVEMKMTGVKEAQFLNTQALPGAGGGIKTFCSGLSNITFGRTCAYYMVQFKDRGI